VEWFKKKISQTTEIYCDLNIIGTKHISDVFKHIRPDLAIKYSNKIFVLELAICHETNLLSSRVFKRNKYANISSFTTEEFKDYSVELFTCECTPLGFVVLEPHFLLKCKLPALDASFISTLAKSLIMSSHSIYSNRNIAQV